MNTNDILESIRYWRDYDANMRMACAYELAGEIHVFPVGKNIEYSDKYGVEIIALAEGDDTPVLGDLIELCRKHDLIRACGQVPNLLLPMTIIYPSQNPRFTLDSKLGDKVAVLRT